MRPGGRSFDVGGLRVHVPDYMAEIVADAVAARSPEPAHQSAIGVSVRLIDRRTTRRWSANARAPRAALRRARRRPPRLRPRGARRFDVGQGRDREHRGRPRRLDHRELGQGFDPHRVQESLHARQAARRHHRVRRGARSPTSAKTSAQPTKPTSWAVCRACASPCRSLTDDESPAAVASAVEFLLEGLHLSKRLNKDAAGARATYRGRG